MRRYKVALIGYYGFGNLGDELLLKASLNILERCGVGRERTIVLSNSPEETSEIFRVDSVSRWSFTKVLKTLSSSETLLLGGGGLFQDSTSLLSCLWYWGIVRLARILGARPFAIGQSIGPLNSGLSRLLARNAIKSCSVVHLRDEKSFDLSSRTFGIKNSVRGIDLALTLATDTENFSLPAKEPKKLKKLNNGKILLLNLRPCRELERFLKIISPHLSYLKSSFDRVIGVALSNEDRAILERLSEELNLSKIVLVRDFSEAQSLWSVASQATGMRLHFGVLSQIFRTPLALMPYDPKVEEFAKQAKVPCLFNEWLDPVMPGEIPEDAVNELIEICRQNLQ